MEPVPSPAFFYHRFVPVVLFRYETRSIYDGYIVALYWKYVYAFLKNGCKNGNIYKNKDIKLCNIYK